MLVNIDLGTDLKPKLKYEHDIKVAYLSRSLIILVYIIIIIIIFIISTIIRQLFLLLDKLDYFEFECKAK